MHLYYFKKLLLWKYSSNHKSRRNSTTNSHVSFMQLQHLPTNGQSCFILSPLSSAANIFSCPTELCYLVTPWTAAYQALPPMGFSRQEYWSAWADSPEPLCSPQVTGAKRSVEKPWHEVGEQGHTAISNMSNSNNLCHGFLLFVA